MDIVTSLEGRVTSHYRLAEKIGEGGMGTVYTARDLRLDRSLAIKVLSGNLTDAFRQQRFGQEARAASALNHPNVVTIYDIDRADGIDFIVMELVVGRSLDRVIPKQGLRTGDVLRYGSQIAGALAAAHAAGIVHRDLKPANVMIADSGHVKLLDFGIAKLAEAVPTGPDGVTASLVRPRTEQGSIVGTVAYMSPEQAQGLPVDARSDIFSLGAVLYEMVTGQRAFSGETNVSTLAAILDKEPEPLSDATPPELNRIIRRCLRKDPARRFQHMSDLQVALDELREDFDSGRLAAPAAAKPSSRRRPLMAAAAAIVVAAAILAAAAWASRKAPGAPVVERHLRQLTFDPGESSQPSLSPDAKLMAYQSDREQPGRFDIWVQQTSGGNAIRLTNGPGDHRRPMFSGDGSTIYFESTGPPQGIYQVPALGGDPRMVASSARGVSVSPDGRWLAYFDLSTNRTLVMPATGGDAHTIDTDLQPVPIGLRRPTWFEDSAHLAVFDRGRSGLATSWWAIPATGGEPVALNWGKWAVDHGHTGYPDVIMGGGAIASLTSTMQYVGNQQIYRVQNDPRANWQAIGEPEPLTSGASWSLNASVAAGRVAFQSGAPVTAVWRIPADTDTGRVTGPPEPLTSEQSLHEHASVSADGRLLVYSSNQNGGLDVYLKDLNSGRERLLAPGLPDLRKSYAAIAPTGSRVVYSRSGARGLLSDVHIIDLATSDTRQVCTECGPTIDISPDSVQALTYQAGVAPIPTIGVIRIDTGKRSTLLQDAEASFTAARLSPDGRWVAFVVSRGASRSDVCVAELHGTESIQRSNWSVLTSSSTDVRQILWSPRGDLVYFGGNVAGAFELNGVRLDAAHRPTGEPFRVYQFTGRLRPVIAPVGGQGVQTSDMLSAVPGAFIGVLSEVNYNIWMMDLPK
jgi:serine/threonine protein kinase